MHYRLGEQYVSLPALGVILACELPAQAFSYPVLPLPSMPVSSQEIQSEELLLTNSFLSSRFFNYRGAEKAGHAECQQAAPYWEA